MDDSAIEISNLFNTNIPPIISMKDMNRINYVQHVDPNFALTRPDNKMCPLYIGTPLFILNTFTKASKPAQKNIEIDGK